MTTERIYNEAANLFSGHTAVILHSNHAVLLVDVCIVGWMGEDVKP
jgi:hypothetical protein